MERVFDSLHNAVNYLIVAAIGGVLALVRMVFTNHQTIKKLEEAAKARDDKLGEILTRHEKTFERQERNAEQTNRSLTEVRESVRRIEGQLSNR